MLAGLTARQVLEWAEYMELRYADPDALRRADGTEKKPSTMIESILRARYLPVPTES